ncbi:MAG: MarR family transcriptional regulator [Ruminococcus sp.]|jgi:DNA-binding MarR family transcriptional regulator|nr:MarR family transcriptional regulator [Ruminococcus sp.]
MSKQNYDVLKLENQLCFPLYACSRQIIRKYHKYLEELNLTYTQYIAMLVFWEVGKINVKELGKRLYLDSGTLTPLLKSLEEKGFVRRYRSKEDERVLLVEITDSGKALREQAVTVPEKMHGCMNLTKEEALTLYKLLYKALS